MGAARGPAGMPRGWRAGCVDAERSALGGILHALHVLYAMHAMHAVHALHVLRTILPGQMPRMMSRWVKEIVGAIAAPSSLPTKARTATARRNTAAA